MARIFERAFGDEAAFNAFLRFAEENVEGFSEIKDAYLELMSEIGSGQRKETAVVDSKAQMARYYSEQQDQWNAAQDAKDEELFSRDFSKMSYNEILTTRDKIAEEVETELGWTELPNDILESRIREYGTDLKTLWEQKQGADAKDFIFSVLKGGTFLSDCPLAAYEASLVLQSMPDIDSRVQKMLGTYNRAELASLTADGKGRQDPIAAATNDVVAKAQNLPLQTINKEATENGGREGTDNGGNPRAREEDFRGTESKERSEPQARLADGPEGSEQVDVGDASGEVSEGPGRIEDIQDTLIKENPKEAKRIKTWTTAKDTVVPKQERRLFNHVRQWLMDEVGIEVLLVHTNDNSADPTLVPPEGQYIVANTYLDDSGVPIVTLSVEALKAAGDSPAQLLIHEAVHAAIHATPKVYTKVTDKLAEAVSNNEAATGAMETFLGSQAGIDYLSKVNDGYGSVRTLFEEFAAWVFAGQEADFSEYYPMKTA